MERKQKYCKLGLIVGVIAIVLGLYVMLGLGEPNYPNYLAFGADFYTEQYAATRAVSMNIIILFNAVRMGASIILMVFGAADIFYFMNKKEEALTQEKIIELLESLQPKESIEDKGIENA